MELRTKLIGELMEQKDLSADELCARSGVDERSFRWAMDGEPVSSQFVERIAGVLEVKPKEISRKDPTTYNENFIEFVTGADQASITLTQKRMISAIRKQAAKHPDVCRIVADCDSAVVAHVPVSWVRIAPPRKVEMTDAQRAAAAERLAKARKAIAE